MTSREEIELLLNKTGRTLKWLPKIHNIAKRIDAAHSLNASSDTTEFICHQSDVIELLVGALRDALDKPEHKLFQKPLTHKEAEDILQSGVRVWVEELGYYEEPEGVNSGYLETEGYGIRWRCWASKPTDEERAAAAWEK